MVTEGKSQETVLGKRGFTGRLRCFFSWDLAEEMWWKERFPLARAEPEDSFPWLAARLELSPLSPFLCFTSPNFQRCCKIP